MFCETIEGPRDTEYFQPQWRRRQRPLGHQLPGYLPGAVVQITTAGGQLVQRFVNYTTPWDGKINGQDAPVGTYYYVIDPRNGRKPMTGFVDIIR